MAGHASLFWSLAGVAGIAGLAPSVQPLPGAAPAAAAGTVLAIPRAADGQFYADATVNGAPLRVMIDPEAAGLTLAPDDAARFGLAAPAASPARLSIGAVSLGLLQARVARSLPVSMLGGAALARLGSVRIEEGRLVVG